MLALGGTWSRSFFMAGAAAWLALAVAAGIVYSAVGPPAAAAVLAGGTLLLTVGLLVAASRRLRQADERLRVGAQALEAVPHALFVVEALQPGRPNRYVNPAYAALTGYGVAEAVAPGFDALGVFADPAKVAALGAELDAPATGRVDLRRRDGTTVPATLDLRAVPHGDGERYFVGLLEKVSTGQRQSDRAAAPPASATEPNGGVQTARPKNAFLSALCHDLRSPLNACVMWLDVLALAPQPDKLTQAVEAIKRNLARQTRLVNDLSDAAKVSAGSLEVRAEPLDLVELLRGNIDAWQLLAIGKQVSFEPSIELASARVLGDPERLLQAVNHLLDNSLASTPAGGRIELRVRGGPGVCVVEVEDTGTALSAEDVENMFVPLWRSATSAKTRPGIGLGLAVAHHLVAKHGGTLTARSNGSQALFTLTMPLLAAGEAQAHTL